MSFILFFAMGFLVAHVFQICTKKWALWDKKTGWQFHHSLFGLFLCLLAVFIPEFRVPLVASGLGIIVEHSLKCGFVFIRKW